MGVLLEKNLIEVEISSFSINMDQFIFSGSRLTHVLFWQDGNDLETKIC